MISSSSFHCTLYAGCRSVTRPLLILSCIIFLQINLPAVAAAKGTPVEGFFLDSTKDKRDIKPLQIGDKVPDIEFQMMNYTSPTARLSDFKGKLVILDFWATWCSSCIEHFPHNEELQKEFADKLQILLVDTKNTGDGIDKIKSFLEKEELIHGRKLGLPCPVNDSIAASYFPHQLIPHYVWIDMKGEVIAITSASDVNRKNIQDAIMSKKLLTYQKSDDEILTGFEKPYLLNSSGRVNKMLETSIFTGVMNVGVSILKMESAGKGKCTGVRLFNYPLSYFFAQAYPEMKVVPFNRHIFNVKDSLKFKMSDKEDTSNMFCFEFISARPVSFDTVMQRYLKDDLYKSFHYRGWTENRVVKCYLIVDDKNSKVKINKQKEIVENKNQKENEVLSLKEFVDRLNGIWPEPVVTDVLSRNVSVNLMNLKKDYSFYEVQNVLLENGYKLIEASRNLPFFILAED